MTQSNVRTDSWYNKNTDGLAGRCKRLPWCPTHFLSGHRIALIGYGDYKYEFKTPENDSLSHLKNTLQLKYMI